MVAYLKSFLHWLYVATDEEDEIDVSEDVTYLED